MKGLSAPSTILVVAAAVFSFVFFANSAEGGTKKGLKVGFYKESCSHVEDVVQAIVTKHTLLDPDLPAGLLRLYFHDCFVTGCDASILLDKTPEGGPTEKDSPANGDTLRGLHVIDEAKEILESECPATVSCADIMAFAARDATTLAGLARYSVPAGRRDGTTSRMEDTLALPSPGLNPDALIAVFASKGFTEAELVVLSGAHSIGGAHCRFLHERFYNFSGDSGQETQDPSMDPAFAELVKARCPSSESVHWAIDSLAIDVPSALTKVPFDLVSPLRLDVAYYRQLQKRKGLLTTDQGLASDHRTSPVVKEMARNQKAWETKFKRAMVKLGAVEVLVGEQGEIRRDCRFVN